MRSLDTRRLTGANLLWDQAGSIMDVSCTEDEAERLLPVWQGLARRMLDAVGWSGEMTCVRRYGYGVSLAVSAPIDALYAACELIEWVWSACLAALGGGPTAEFSDDLQRAAARLQEMIAEERNPALLSLRDAAQGHGVAFLSDDDYASVGSGTGAMIWPVGELPTPDQVAWDEVHDIPVGLVTGTNGKTTTTRLAASIAMAARRSVGISSTDGIAVAGRMLERGDFSGPGGARSVLRHREVDTAILETARGGLLRRGLGVQRADAVVITTIAEDHLGDFGSRTVDELLAIKWVLSRALLGHGQLILNADEPKLVQMATQATAAITWFSLSSVHPVVCRHIEAGGRAVVLRDGELVMFGEGRAQPLCRIEEIPLTLGGAAVHNVSNALAATALAAALGITVEHIIEGLRAATFHDNPGRCNLFDIGGRQVVVDFAHNPQAMQAVFDFARALPAERRLLSFGQAGDRPDGAIRELAGKAWAIGLDRVHLVELPKYDRGRRPGEVCEILRSGLIEVGAPTTSLVQYPSELASLTAALEWAQPGDLVLIMALANSAEIVAHLSELSTQQEMRRLLW